MRKIISIGEKSKCKGPGAVWLEGSKDIRVRAADDVRKEGASEIMKSLVGYAKGFGFHCKVMESQRRISSRR